MSIQGPIERRRLHDEIADRLLEAIRRGDYPAGARLPSERELMAAFGVGRPAVREAMQALKNKGVIQITHGERAEVVEMTPGSVVDGFTESVRAMLATNQGTLEQLKEARLFFEIGVARLAAARADEEGIARLRAVLDRQHEARTRRAEFVRLDGEFHATIAELAGNPFFAALSRGLFTWLSEYHGQSVHMPGLEHLTLEEHDAIFEQIRRRDPAATEAAVRDHLTRANALYHRGAAQTVEDSE